MNNILFRGIIILSLLSASFCQAQKTIKFNLGRLLKNNGLAIYPRQDVGVIKEARYNGISLTGIAWLKGISFSTGSIDVDLRGKDVFQQSFLGIAFHGVDTLTYDAIYFRPFNFRSADTLRRKHAVQYISQPAYPWDRLRKAYPLVYENGILHPPPAAHWFHAHIVVNENEVKVYVNHSVIPSLVVKKLNDRINGLIGLWNDGLNGDFANLVIKTSK